MRTEFLFLCKLMFCRRRKFKYQHENVCTVYVLCLQIKKKKKKTGSKSCSVSPGNESDESVADTVGVECRMRLSLLLFSPVPVFLQLWHVDEMCQLIDQGG